MDENPTENLPEILRQKPAKPRQRKKSAKQKGDKENPPVIEILSLEADFLADDAPVKLPEGAIEEQTENREATPAEKYRIIDLAEADRPRERLVRLGAQSLTNAELIAILLRMGVPGENAVQVGQRLLNHFGGLAGLHRADVDLMCAEHGIGLAKAAHIKAAIELGNRLRLEAPDERSAIHSPADAAALVQYEMSALEQEEMRVILLDTRNRVLNIVNVYRGSVNSSQVRIGELFRSAIRQNAPALIVLHNHPSGDPTPSPDDVAVTRAIVQAGKLLDIDVLDHLVIGQGRYVSLKERGLGFG